MENLDRETKDWDQVEDTDTVFNFFELYLYIEESAYILQLTIDEMSTDQPS